MTFWDQRRPCSGVVALYDNRKRPALLLRARWKRSALVLCPRCKSERRPPALHCPCDAVPMVRLTLMIALLALAAAGTALVLELTRPADVADRIVYVSHITSN